MEDMPGFSVSDDCMGLPPVETMSGFSGSNDFMGLPPVENMSGFSVSDDCMGLPPFEKMPGFMRLPPGFRFYPTDEELITFYLCRKIADSSFCATAIGEADLNRFEPWDLPSLLGVSAGEREWYFFSLRDRKHCIWQRPTRATDSGYWKATEKDREIFRVKTLVGMKKTLVFYKGRAPRGAMTNWVMHEYGIEGDYLHNLPESAKNEWVICKVFLNNSEEKKTEISKMPTLMAISQIMQTLAKASNEEDDTSVNSINVADIEKYVVRRSTLKRKKASKHVEGVSQLIDLPKQQSNLHAENAGSSSSMSTHGMTMQKNTRVWVKVGYNNDTVKFMLPFATMDSLKREILKRYKLEAETLKIRYKDEDEETVNIACDEDLHYCLEFFKSTGRAPVRLSLSKE